MTKVFEQEKKNEVCFLSARSPFHFPFSILSGSNLLLFLITTSPREIAIRFGTRGLRGRGWKKRVEFFSLALFFALERGFFFFIIHPLAHLPCPVLAQTHQLP